MKTTLSTSAIILLCTAIFFSCSEEYIAPGNEIPNMAGEKLEMASVQEVTIQKKKSDNDNSLTTEVTGNIDGREFTGNLTVTEFTEVNGEVHAQSMLSDVKIKGKDHKYLEFVLEQESYSVPVTVSGVAEATGEIGIAQTCTVLELNFQGLTTDVLGMAVNIDPVVITLSGEDNEVLGNLICTVLDTLNNVVDLVGLVNQILGLLSL